MQEEWDLFSAARNAYYRRAYENVLSEYEDADADKEEEWVQREIQGMKRKLKDKGGKGGEAKFAKKPRRYDARGVTTMAGRKRRRWIGRARRLIRLISTKGWEWVETSREGGRLCGRLGLGKTGVWASNAGGGDQEAARRKWLEEQVAAREKEEDTKTQEEK